MQDLKERAVRGGFAKICSQALNIVLRVGSVAVLARLLDPKDFGLVAMVTVVTGVYELFTTAGLSWATVQKRTITDQQISTVFWLNVLIGLLLALLCVATGPTLVAFYHEPRLLWVTSALALGFIFNAAGVQHSAILQRRMAHVTLASIETFAFALSAAVGVGMAIAGFGYWSLVAMAVASPAISTGCFWLTARWIPGRPRWEADTNSMLRMGGSITLNRLVVYTGYNAEKILLGRFWGPDALGLYGRAFQIINFPTSAINVAIGSVAFAALSRLQGEPARLKSYFLKCYTLINSATIPTTIFCALFADDIIAVLLGPKWGDAASIFRLLAPTVLVFGMMEPLGWMLLSIGRQDRSLAMAFVITPLVITACVAGLPYGPSGVALAYSTALVLWLPLHIVWALHDTMFFPSDILAALARPLAASSLAGATAIGLKLLCGTMPPFFMMLLGGATMLICYIIILMFVMGDKGLYIDIISNLKRSGLANQQA